MEVMLNYHLIVVVMRISDFVVIKEGKDKMYIQCLLNHKIQVYIINQ